MSLWVVLNNTGFDVNSNGSQSIISGILFSACLIFFLVLRKNIFLLFCIAFATWSFFSITSLLVDNRNLFDVYEFYKYRVLLLGVAYIFLGYGFSQDERRLLSEVLYGVGSFCFLIAALALGCGGRNPNLFWEIIYPVLVFILMGLSVRFKSEILLACSTFFLIVYIFKMVAEYFSKNLGWSLSWAIIGFAMIGVGYLAVSVVRKW